MTPEQIDRVFGRGRLKMVTGEHVEVYREAVGPTERRRYTKRFLNTPDGDFGQWTEREWRILARLIGHGIACVPDVVQVDRGRLDRAQLVQTYDAGVTVDQWATLLPVTRDGRVYGHVFEDCAHWWALAHHCLLALNVIHPLELVHLDIKGDNVCIPYAPASFDPNSDELRLQPVFGQLALIDFAFALISRATLTTPLPIGWQKDYDYQSPRLLTALEAGRNGNLQLTRDLDWRCDLYSLAAMLRRYLPSGDKAAPPLRVAGWTPERYDAAKELILRVRALHDGELPRERPHAELIEITGEQLREEELARSLERGWTFAREANVAPTAASPLTPVTLLARPVSVMRSGRVTAVTVLAPPKEAVPVHDPRTPATPAAAVAAAAPPRKRFARGAAAMLGAVALTAVAAALWYAENRSNVADDEAQAMLQPESPGSIERNVAAPAAASDGTAAPAIANAEIAHPAEEGAAHQPTAEQSRHESPAQRAQASRAPAAGNGEAATTPAAAEPAQRETPATAKASSRVAEARAAESRPPAPEVRKPPMSAKQAAAAQRAAEKVARREAALAQRAAQSRGVTATNPKETRETKERVYAPWAALEPPAWALSSYRGRGPGVPRGAEGRSQPAAESASPPSSPTSSPTTVAPAVTTTASAPSPAPLRVEPANPAPPQPASSPSVAAVPQADAPRIVPVPPSAPPPRVTSAVNADRVVQEDYGAIGRQTLHEAVPRIAARAEPQVARVLGMAAGAYHLLEERAVAQASRAARIEDAEALPLSRMTAASDARRLSDEARSAFRSRRDVREALDLQLRAFGANPRDPEITGQLASLYLRVTPAQPEMARQLALVALAARAPQYHSARMEDWNTFAIASALTGRESDARNALYVTLALTADVDTRCVAALNAVATYGDRLRKPVEAMFHRLHTQGRGIGSQACAWPPSASLASRLQ